MATSWPTAIFRLALHRDLDLWYLEMQVFHLMAHHRPAEQFCAAAASVLHDAALVMHFKKGTLDQMSFIWIQLSRYKTNEIWHKRVNTIHWLGILVGRFWQIMVTMFQPNVSILTSKRLSMVEGVAGPMLRMKNLTNHEIPVCNRSKICCLYI